MCSRLAVAENMVERSINFHFDFKIFLVGENFSDKAKVKGAGDAVFQHIRVVCYEFAEKAFKEERESLFTSKSLSKRSVVNINNPVAFDFFGGTFCVDHAVIDLKVDVSLANSACEFYHLFSSAFFCALLQVGDLEVYKKLTASSHYGVGKTFAFANGRKLKNLSFKALEKEINRPIVGEDGNPIPIDEKNLFCYKNRRLVNVLDKNLFFGVSGDPLMLEDGANFYYFKGKLYYYMDGELCRFACGFMMPQFLTFYCKDFHYVKFVYAYKRIFLDSGMESNFTSVMECEVFDYAVCLSNYTVCESSFGKITDLQHNGPEYRCVCRDRSGLVVLP